MIRRPRRLFGSQSVGKGGPSFLMRNLSCSFVRAREIQTRVALPCLIALVMDSWAILQSWVVASWVKAGKGATRREQLNGKVLRTLATNCFNNWLRSSFCDSRELK